MSKSDVVRMPEMENINLHAELLADISKYENPDLLSTNILLFLDELYYTNKINNSHVFTIAEIEIILEFAFHSIFQEDLFIYALDKMDDIPVDTTSVDIDKFIELYKLSVEEIVIDNQKNNNCNAT